MSAKKVMTRVMRSPGSMHNSLPSSREWSMYDCCLGVHGAMKRRRGVKHGTVTARSRFDKIVVSTTAEE